MFEPLMITSNLQLVNTKKKDWKTLHKGDKIRVRGKFDAEVIFKDCKLVVVKSVSNGMNRGYNLNDFITGYFNYEKLGGIKNG